MRQSEKIIKRKMCSWNYRARNCLNVSYGTNINKGTDLFYSSEHGIQYVWTNKINKSLLFFSSREPYRRSHQKNDTILPCIISWLDTSFKLKNTWSTFKSDIACKNGSLGAKYAKAATEPWKETRPATSSELNSLYEIQQY